jgi:hypothetical protein
MQHWTAHRFPLFAKRRSNLALDARRSREVRRGEGERAACGVRQVGKDLCLFPAQKTHKL